MKQFKMSALVLALTSIAAGSAMAQSSKTNAWEGAYGQIGVGFGIFTPSISNGKAVAPAPYSAANITTSASSVNNVNTGLANLALGYNFGINQSYILGLGATYYPGASSSATGVLNSTAAAPYGALSSSTTATGWTLGLGYKQILTGSIYAFGEVNYAAYGNKGVATITSSSGAVLSGMSAKGTGTDILVGVGYRF